jgi:hypothetical protein
MYQTDFLCTYKQMLDKDDQETLYRIQLLQAFDLDTWDDTVIDHIVYDIYTTIAPTEEFKQIFTKAQQNTSILEMLAVFKGEGEGESEDENANITKEEIIFTLLFNFEYFELLHRCVSDHLRDGVIKKGNFEMLLNAL